MDAISPETTDCTEWTGCRLARNESARFEIVNFVLRKQSSVLWGWMNNRLFLQNLFFIHQSSNLACFVWTRILQYYLLNLIRSYYHITISKRSGTNEQRTLTTVFHPFHPKDWLERSSKDDHFAFQKVKVVLLSNLSSFLQEGLARSSSAQDWNRILRTKAPSKRNPSKRVYKAPVHLQALLRDQTFYARTITTHRLQSIR